MLIGFLSFGAGAVCFAGTIVYDNLGSGSDVYNDVNSWAVIGPGTILGPTIQSAPAEPFTPGSTVYFTQLDMALSYFLGTNTVTVDLMSDSSGPGAVLESWSVSNLPSVLTCCALQVLSGNGSILLESGTTYWVAVLPGNSDTFALWNLNSTGATATEFENFGNGWVPNPGISPTGAFEVQGNSAATPEPSTITLLGAGILGLAGVIRRRLIR